MAGLTQRRFDPEVSPVPSVPINPPSKSGSQGAENDSRYITKIGNQSFHLETWAWNGMDNYPPFLIPTKFIEEISIEEVLEDWNYNGYITIDTSFEILERGFNVQDIPDANKIKDPYMLRKIKEPYMLRSDGRNRLYIKIYPLSTDPETGDTAKSDERIVQNWEMVYNAVIYNIEDLPTEKSNSKLRRFYFWDERYQVLLERNMEWSTSTHGTNGGANSKDIDRTMPISYAIKSIIKTAASNTYAISDNFGEQSNSNPQEIGNDTGAINDVQIGLEFSDLARFSPEWDGGIDDITQGNILYTSPANCTAIDDLDYMLSLFRCEDGSPGVLTLDRFSVEGGKRFSLISFKNIIKKAEENQIEHLMINDLIDPNTSHFARAPEFRPEERKTDVNFTSTYASNIDKYQFHQMSPMDDLQLVNSPVHNFNFEQNEFRIFHKKNSIKNLISEAKSIFEEGLYSFKNGGSGQVLLNFNKTKSEGLMTKNVLIPQTFFPQDYSLIKNLYNFLLLNQSIYFSVNGLTIRTPGKFIYIDRPNVSEDKNAFDDRFLGQWMITKVVHRFTKSSYTTDVIAIKPDLFNKYWEEEEDIV